MANNNQPPDIDGILIVDDSALQRGYAVDLCRELGISRIDEASDGACALAVLDSLPQPPTVLMIDLEMPEMDGIELIQHLVERNLQIPLIVASSREAGLLMSVESMIKALGQPLLGSLQKPLKLEQLQTMLARIGSMSGDKSAPQTGIKPLLGESDLVKALSESQIVPFYQPKVDLNTGIFKGVEALARWIHPVHGLIMPDQFIPIAEKSLTLTQLLTMSIAEQSIRQCAAWNNLGLKLTVAINLSPILLDQLDFFKEVAWLPESQKVPCQQIVWEITESSVVNNLGTALGTLARLRLKGFGLSIDDYGTGFSSMQQLARIPFTELKIDRSFVDGAAEHHNLEVILQSAVEMSHKLNMSCVAEGVETLEDWYLLQRLGCNMVQGYLIGKPMPASDIASWLKLHNQRHSELHIGS